MKVVSEVKALINVPRLSGKPMTGLPARKEIINYF